MSKNNFKNFAQNLPQATFITGIGTEIGKTYILQQLTKHANFDIIKPIASGIEDENDPASDCAIILRILKKDLNKKNINQITPYCFKTPISPNMAANLENKPINFDELVNFCQEKITKSKNQNQKILIEGAGGLMTPITDNKTFLDLIKSLNIPILLITTNQLGSISHTLTYYNYAKSQNIKIHKIILNQIEKNQINPTKLEKTLTTLTNPNIILSNNSS